MTWNAQLLCSLASHSYTRGRLQPAFSSPSLDCLSPASPSLQCEEEGLWLFFFSQKVSMTTGAVAELWLLVKLAVSSLVSLASLRSLI